MLKQFIDKPVFSTVISIIIVILGILGLTALPITQYPDIAPPTIEVSATYPGANAETVLKSVVAPIEEQINGVEGMKYITSTASNSGRASIQVFFNQGIDPDIAAVNVQNRVSSATSLLPQEVVQSGVTTKKQQTSSLMFFTVLSNNDEYGATYIQNYLKINVVPEIKRIDGVGDVRIFGNKEYAMRIWLNPQKLKAYNLMPSDVTTAINEQSLEAAAGALGQNNGQAFEYVIRYGGRYQNPEQYEDIIIKSLGKGQFLRLKDVAKVELDAQGYNVISYTNNKPGVSMAVYQTPGSNAREIIQNIHKKLDEFKQDFPPGFSVLVNFDSNAFLNASIEKVIITLFEAFLLVFLVVFIFLQDLRSTLIPAIAVPVSIVGTFFFLNLFGYSINLLTLFALVLAIGIVVDDAIVVVEAVHAKMEEGASSASRASHHAMEEITSAIISITLVMAAVFVPVTFLKGPTGVFYEQFGITLMVAIAISALNALTLSPALCALVLKPHKESMEKKKGVTGKIFSRFNRGFQATTQRYVRSLGFLYRHKWITGAIILAAIAGILLISYNTSTGFVPNEDRGVVFANIELPAGASLDRTVSVTRKLYKKISKIKGVEGGSLVNGYSLISGAGSNYGLGFLKLESWDDRGADSLSANAIIGKMFRAAATIPGADILFFAPPSVPGFGVSSGFEMQVLDRSGGKFTELDKTTRQYLRKLMQRPEVQFAQSSFNTNYPQYLIKLDIPKAKEAGINVSSIFRTLQGYIGGIYTADFTKFGKQFRVYVQALPEDRADKADLNSMYVRNNQGEMAPISEFVKLKKVYGPQAVTRFNLFNAASVNGSPAPGYSSGDAIEAVQETAASELPTDFDIAFSGLTREEVKAGNQAILIVFLSVVFVYFILAAQYESYLIPLSVLLSLPVGIFGAYLTTYLAGLRANIFFQIALIMLLGLLAKNAILIVEFAIQRRKTGMSITEAAYEGARVRLRPVLMTSLAFSIGLLPLALASGVGAKGNHSIGTGAVGGMLVGTALGIFVIPLMYILFQWLQDKVSSKPKPQNTDENNAPSQ